MGARSGADDDGGAPTLVPDLYRITRRLRRIGGTARLDVAALMLLHRAACLGSTRPSDLAADVGLDSSTVSRHIKALEDEGLMSREPDPDDGRSVRLGVTPAGRDLMAEAWRRREGVVEQVLTTWPEGDATALRRLLTRLADDLDRLEEETR